MFVDMSVVLNLAVKLFKSESPKMFWGLRNTPLLWTDEQLFLYIYIYIWVNCPFKFMFVINWSSVGSSRVVDDTGQRSQKVLKNEKKNTSSELLATRERWWAAVFFYKHSMWAEPCEKCSDHHISHNWASACLQEQTQQSVIFPYRWKRSSAMSDQELHSNTLCRLSILEFLV